MAPLPSTLAGLSESGCFLLILLKSLQINYTIWFWGRVGPGLFVSLLHSALRSLWFRFHKWSDAGSQSHSLLLFKLLVFRTDLRNPVYLVPKREVTAEGKRQQKPPSSSEHAGAL